MLEPFPIIRLLYVNKSVSKNVKKFWKIQKYKERGSYEQ